MKLLKLILAVVFATTAFAATAIPATQTAGEDYVPGELIVRFEHGIIDMPGFEETA